MAAKIRLGEALVASGKLREAKLLLRKADATAHHPVRLLPWQIAEADSQSSGARSLFEPVNRLSNPILERQFAIWPSAVIDLERLATVRRSRLIEYGSPDWIRTSYLVLRRHALYPNELRDHFLTAFSPAQTRIFLRRQTLYPG